MMKLDHSTKAFAAVRAAPRESLGTHIKRIAFGVPVAVGGSAAAYFLEWPWYACVAVVLFGLAIAAPVLVSGALKLVMGALKDVVATVKPAPPPPTSP
jgi:hypothetical protein